MASLMENYEQQYAVLTADITAKIGKLASSHGGMWHRYDYLCLNMLICHFVVTVTEAFN
jgi:hypothetical protein